MLVPTELIGHIFSFLRGDSSSLEACSKAHPIFSSIAEPYIYADILVPMNYKTAVSELYKQLSGNPYILNFPRTLEFRFAGSDFSSRGPPEPEVLLIMSMIPQMANLVSLTVADQWPYRLRECEDFMSTFKICFQQATIEELTLEHFRCFPLSILDGKTIKKLTLSDCRALSEDEPTPGSLHQPPETLIIRSCCNRTLLLWASHRATSLTTLELRDSHKPYLMQFANLLRACSKTLTRLHLDIDSSHQSIFRFNRQSHSYGSAGRWINDHQAFPFTLSAHRCLTEVTIFAQIRFDSNARIHCALPAILRLIKTAPSISVVLNFRRDRLWRTTHIPLNLSPLLERFRSDFPPASGVCPRIDLHINHDLSDCPLTISDVLETTDNEDSD